jgi:hypothetical protein
VTPAAPAVPAGPFVPGVVVAFVDAVRRRDLAALHALIDWEETGRRRVHSAAAQLGEEVDPAVRDEIVRRGLDESRRAPDDPELVQPYLGALLGRLGTVRGIRRSGPADGDAEGDAEGEQPDAEANVDPPGADAAGAGQHDRATYVVQGDDALLLAAPLDATRAVILGWL